MGWVRLSICAFKVGVGGGRGEEVRVARTERTL